MTRKSLIGKADRGLRHHPFELCRFGTKRVDLAVRHGLAAHRRELRRIDKLTVFLHTEMKVWPRRQSGRADIADDGLGIDPLAELDTGEFAEVHVRGLDAAVVADHHQIASAAARTTKRDDTW